MGESAEVFYVCKTIAGTGIGAAALSALFIVLIHGALLRARARRQQRARQQVLGSKSLLACRIAAAEAKMIEAFDDVKKDTRAAVEGLKNEFSQISRLNALTCVGDVDWEAVSEQVNEMQLKTNRVVSKMDEEIAFARSAREKCPSLLREVPDLLTQVKNLLQTGGVGNPNAAWRFATAAAHYDEIRRVLDASTGEPDWVKLYPVLVGIKRDCELASRAPVYMDEFA